MSKKTRLNYANDSHFELALQRYGGESYLKENFPRILQMLHDTRQWQAENSELNDTDGYQDTFLITQLLTNNDTSAKHSIFARSNMSLVQNTSFVHMSSKTIDPKYGKMFGGYAVSGQNLNKLDKSLLIDHSYLTYGKERQVKTETHFATFQNVNGKTVCSADVNRDLTIDLDNFAPDIKQISAVQPASRTSQDTVIRIVYNGRSDANAAYNFPEAKRLSNDYVEVYYPFQIEVKLADMFVFTENPVEFDYTFNLSLASSVVDGGEVHFNTAKINNIQTSVSGKVLTLSLPYSQAKDKTSWYVAMPLTAKQAEGVFDFHLSFSINYRYTGGGPNLTAPIVISSENLPSSDNFIKIKQSKIVWGCLGKNTMLKTESGYKKIDEIKCGEMIFTDKGFIALKNMVTGVEEKIIAVSVSKDKTLYITKEHPIATERGIIRAIDLFATDKLMLEDGSYQDIYHLEVLDYNDKVYSPELETPASILADGIMVGDYLTKTNAQEPSQKEAEPIDSELLAELNRWTELENERIQREVNV